jgi:hypothetical protein
MKSVLYFVMMLAVATSGYSAANPDGDRDREFFFAKGARMQTVYPEEGERQQSNMCWRSLGATLDFVRWAGQTTIHSFAAALRFVFYTH